MTSPSPLEPQRNPRVNKANWLGRYLDVEQDFDDKLKGVLTEALSSVQDAFGDLRDDTISGKAKRQQFSLAGKAIRGVIGDIFGRTGNLVRDHQQDAAMAAVDAELYDDRGFLARIFKDSNERAQYADSLRATAARNIDATLTRVFETEKPLSRKVYESRSLATGQVSRAINNALARGDSARDLAKAVESMIDPNVPGGVSYAARRLGRTEINNAFHAQSIHDAQESPWTEKMRWNLSKTHAVPDECEDYAAIGLFDVNHVPEKPHPNCRCFVTPDTKDYKSFEDDLVSGKYDDYLDKVLGVDTLETRRAREAFSEGSAKFQEEVAEAKASGRDIYPWPGISPADRKLVNKFNNDRQSAALSDELEVPERKVASKAKLKPSTKVPKSIEAAKDVQEVGNWLTSQYEGLELKGWDYKAVDPRAAKEIAQAFVDRHAQFPSTGLRRIVIKPIVDNGDPFSVSAETIQKDPGGNGEIVMNINLNELQDYDQFKADKNKLRAAKFFSDRAGGERPWRSTFIHEFGHVIDNSAGRDALSYELNPKTAPRGGKVGTGLFERFNPDGDVSDPKQYKEYEKWVLDNVPSGYSWVKKSEQKIHPEELVAEGFSTFMEGTAEQKNPLVKAITNEINKRMKLARPQVYIRKRDD